MRSIFPPALLICGLATAQTKPCPGDFRNAAPWLEGYHHAPAPQPVAMAPTDPLLEKLADAEHAAMTIAREARLEDNSDAAARAIQEARDTAALTAEVRARLAPQAAAGAPIFLFALKDETIRPAVAWWVEDDRLHYITPSGMKVQAPLDALDRALTERLNRERNLEVRLPPSR